MLAVSERPAPLILTAALDPASAERLDALRRRHFPPERNHLRAHLTLFHHLPGEERAAVERDLAAAAGRHRPCPYVVERVLRLGAGVAYGLHAPELVALRGELAATWAPWLTRQDRRALRPHVTVQNKVAPEAAARLHAELSADFTPWSGAAAALELWRYEGGPWTALGRWALAR
jgi:2'-5' RNA ligase